MDNVVMERSFLKGNIPIWNWNGIPVIRIGMNEFVTAQPVLKDVRSLNQAKKIASDFAIKNGCYANVTYDTEWHKLMEFLKTNFVTHAFFKENMLYCNEVLLLDSITEGDTHVLAGGEHHRMEEIFQGFISGDDCDGEPQPRKLLFLTITL